MAIFRLNEEIAFPDPTLADFDGLLAIGGDLSVERLILAYSNGIFPWYNRDDPIMWWCPKEDEGNHLVCEQKSHIGYRIRVRNIMSL